MGYVNENTYTDWSLGEFKHSPFNYEFASLGSTVGKRTGRDVVNFHLRHSGEAYSTKSDLTMPTGVDSGVAYHTQIENVKIAQGFSLFLDTRSNHIE